jgi:hypothetical protein
MQVNRKYLDNSSEVISELYYLFVIRYPTEMPLALVFSQGIWRWLHCDITVIPLAFVLLRRRGYGK